MTGRVFNGQEWHDVQEYATTGKHRPLPPILNGDGRIFVSIASFRDGSRCGRTIIDLFAKAKDPDNIVVGIIDQSAESDQYCLEAYCKEMGHDIYKKISIREDTLTVIAMPERSKCPRINQIRKLSVYDIAAKGPVWARSIARKILGNEEFCLQIDAHSEFVPGWDDKVKHEWAATGNEFGIISTVPPAIGDTEDDNSVPRQCWVTFQEIGTPAYSARGDGKVENLQKPLLSHAWSAGFSFSKCHLEESTPYDPFTPYVMGVEQFARFARFWTRGYDVYTPTQNIVYHNFQPNPDGHGPMEWLKPRFERFRQASLHRIRTILELPKGIDGFNRANFGIYGLGKRRTLKQLADFVRIDMDAKGDRPDSISCGDDQWVPYDTNISPVDNLYDKPDNLDPQPEFPLRTEMAFYKETSWDPPKLEILEGDVFEKADSSGAKPPPATVNQPIFPSASLLLVFWVIGLILWCSIFLRPATSGPKGSRKNRRVPKLVKDV